MGNFRAHFRVLLRLRSNIAPGRSIAIKLRRAIAFAARKAPGRVRISLGRANHAGFIPRAADSGAGEDARTTACLRPALRAMRQLS